MRGSGGRSVPAGTSPTTRQLGIVGCRSTSGGVLGAPVLAVKLAVAVNGQLQRHGLVLTVLVFFVPDAAQDAKVAARINGHSARFGAFQFVLVQQRIGQVGSGFGGRAGDAGLLASSQLDERLIEFL